MELRGRSKAASLRVGILSAKQNARFEGSQCRYQAESLSHDDMQRRMHLVLTHTKKYTQDPSNFRDRRIPETANCKSFHDIQFM